MSESPDVEQRIQQRQRVENTLAAVANEPRRHGTTSRKALGRNRRPGGNPSDQVFVDAEYDRLDDLFVEYFSSAPSEVLDVTPFSGLIWPRTSLGNVTRDTFLCLREFLLYAFYWRNATRYRTFFDVGANVGSDCLIAAHLGYEVSAFEPDPDCFQELVAAKEANRFDRLHLIGAAISDSVGEAAFVRVKGNTTYNHLRGQRDFYGEHDDIHVKTTTFDAVGSFPDLMKINVEGHEAVVVSTIPKAVWSTMDAFIDVHDVEKRDALFDYFQSTGVNLFPQKTGWNQTTDINDLPAGSEDGYLFVSTKDEMPW